MNKLIVGFIFAATIIVSKHIYAQYDGAWGTYPGWIYPGCEATHILRCQTGK